MLSASQWGSVWSRLKRPLSLLPLKGVERINFLYPFSDKSGKNRWLHFLKVKLLYKDVVKIRKKSIPSSVILSIFVAFYAFCVAYLVFFITFSKSIWKFLLLTTTLASLKKENADSSNFLSTFQEVSALDYCIGNPLPCWFCTGDKMQTDD